MYNVLSKMRGRELQILQALTVTVESVMILSTMLVRKRLVGISRFVDVLDAGARSKVKRKRSQYLAFAKS